MMVPRPDEPAPAPSFCLVWKMLGLVCGIRWQWLDEIRQRNAKDTYVKRGRESARHDGDGADKQGGELHVDLR